MNTCSKKKKARGLRLYDVAPIPFVAPSLFDYLGSAEGIALLLLALALLAGGIAAILIVTRRKK